MAEQDRRLLQERLSNLQSDMESASVEHDRVKREWTGRHDQQNNTIQSLHADVKELKDRLEDVSYVQHYYYYRQHAVET